MNWKNILERVVSGVILLCLVGGFLLIRDKVIQDKKDKEFLESIKFQKVLNDMVKDSLQ